jgi:iron-sulfur cluster assembly protein
MLLVMMGNALEQNRKEDAETCREALRSFASDHLGEWLVPFCDRLEEIADLAFHYSAAQLLRGVWARLSARHGLASAKTQAELEPAPEVGRGVRLTERAAKRVHQVMRDSGLSPDRTWLRVGAKVSSRSGTTCVLDFDQEGPTELDATAEMHGVKLVIDRRSDLFVGGTTVDLDDSLLNLGGRLENPLDTGSCGCGTSLFGGPT